MCKEFFCGLEEGISKRGKYAQARALLYGSESPRHATGPQTSPVSGMLMGGLNEDVSNRDDSSSKIKPQRRKCSGTADSKWLSTEVVLTQRQQSSLHDEAKQNKQKLQRPQVGPGTGLTRATESRPSAFLP